MGRFPEDNLDRELDLLLVALRDVETVTVTRAQLLRWKLELEIRDDTIKCLREAIRLTTCA